KGNIRMCETTIARSCDVPHTQNGCRPEHHRSNNVADVIELKGSDKFGRRPRDQVVLWTVTTTMSTRHDGRRRERSWERDERDRDREKDRYSRGGRAGGQRDGGRKRDSRSRSPRRGRSRFYECHICSLSHIHR